MVVRSAGCAASWHIGPVPQIIDRESNPEWRGDVNVAAVFYLPLSDVLPVEDGHVFAFRQAPPGAVGRLFASLEKARTGRRLLGPLDVSLRFFRIPLQLPDNELRSVLDGRHAGGPQTGELISQLPTCCLTPPGQRNHLKWSLRLSFRSPGRKPCYWVIPTRINSQRLVRTRWSERSSLSSGFRQS